VAVPICRTLRARDQFRTARAVNMGFVAAFLDAELRSGGAPKTVFMKNADLDN